MRRNGIRQFFKTTVGVWPDVTAKETKGVVNVNDAARSKERLEIRPGSAIPGPNLASNRLRAPLRE